MSAALVAVLGAMDRSAKVCEYVAPVGKQEVERAQRLYQQHLEADCLLITDGKRKLRKAARQAKIENHKVLIGKKARGTKVSVTPGTSCR